MITRSEFASLLANQSTLEIERPSSPSVQELKSGTINLPLKEPLGSGLLAVVMKGRNEETGKDVAIKLCLPKIGPEDPAETREHLETNFWNEEKLLPKEEPSHHLPIFFEKVTFTTDMGELNGYTRELLVQTADKAVTKADLAATTRMAEDIADALEYIHQEHGLIVYDVNPENIMTRNDDSFVLSDLNLASDGSSREDTYTEGFVAPEVANLSNDGFSLTAATYSLAMTAFTLLGGEIETDEMASALGQPSLVKPNSMSDEVFIIIQKATSLEPGNRPSPSEFAKALKEAAAIK